MGHNVNLLVCLNIYTDASLLQNPLCKFCYDNVLGIGLDTLRYRQEEREKEIFFELC